MECSLPPQLTNDEIDDVLDGIADSSVYAHLERCPFCRQRIEHERHLDVKLESLLIPMFLQQSHPAAQTLQDYHFNLLKKSERDMVFQHVQLCSDCQRHLAELRTYLESSAAITSKPEIRQDIPRKPLKELIAQLTSPGQGPQLSYRGSRGPLMFEAEGVYVFLDVQPGVPPILVGQIVAETPKVWIGGLVELRQAGELQGTTTVSDMGTFECPMPQTTAIDLRVTTGGGNSIVVKGVVLSE